MPPTIPNFLVIGAQKAGTTYLCAGLARHPDIYFSNPKELMFFNRPMHIGESEFRDYLVQHFDQCGQAPWIGEGSTTYFQWPRALPRIRKHLGPDLKLFLCLRHPVEKALSFYLHNWRQGRLTGTESIFEFDEGDVVHSPLGTSYYAKHLERWLAVYEREHIHVLLFDLLKTSRAEFLRSATDFLNISPLSVATEKVINPGPKLMLNDDRLVVHYPAAAKNRPRPVFSFDDISRLQSMFTDDIQRTEELLGIDLTLWRTQPVFRR